jgi:hypothetical protein
MKSVLLIVTLIATLFAFGCAAPNKFCQFEAFGVKKCVQLDNQLTEQRCKDMGGTPAKDCGK